MKIELYIFGNIILSYFALAIFTKIHNTLVNGTLLSSFAPFSITERLLFLILTTLVGFMVFKLVGMNGFANSQ
ncbi:hypothetical protein [Methanococcoides burtonii]|uniref:hypothetical protein n=1 Tax=Methanococcoides burtonii TaxID=29291 RepID=UPI00064FF91B|nr:hypothetical protein [Methanococcoides burtonii]